MGREAQVARGKLVRRIGIVSYDESSIRKGVSSSNFLVSSHDDGINWFMYSQS